MRRIILVTFALTFAAAPTPCAAQTPRDSVADSVVVFVQLNQVQAPFGIQYAGALLAVRSALHGTGLVIARTSPRVITVAVSAQVVPPLAGVFPDYLEPFLEEVEWRVNVSYAMRNSAEFTTWRQTQGRSFIGTWAAAATTGMRTAVLSAVRAHAYHSPKELR